MLRDQLALDNRSHHAVKARDANNLVVITMANEVAATDKNDRHHNTNVVFLDMVRGHNDRDRQNRMNVKLCNNSLAHLAAELMNLFDFFVHGCDWVTCKENHSTHELSSEFLRFFIKIMPTDMRAELHRCRPAWLFIARIEMRGSARDIRQGFFIHEDS